MSMWRALHCSILPPAIAHGDISLLLCFETTLTLSMRGYAGRVSIRCGATLILHEASVVFDALAFTKVATGLMAPYCCAEQCIPGRINVVIGDIRGTLGGRQAREGWYIADIGTSKQLLTTETRWRAQFNGHATDPIRAARSSLRRLRR